MQNSNFSADKFKNTKKRIYMIKIHCFQRYHISQMDVYYLGTSFNRDASFISYKYVFK